MGFKFYKQYDAMDCGPTCLRMIARHHGRTYTQQTMTRLCDINREGVSLLGISEAAEKIGFRSIGVKFNAQELKKTDLPCMLHWRQYHFVVLYKIRDRKYYLADPAVGLVSVDEQNFKKSWQSYKETQEGIALILSPSPQFVDMEN